MRLAFEETYSEIRYRVGRSIFTITNGWVGLIEDGAYVVWETIEGPTAVQRRTWRVPAGSILSATVAR